MTYEVIQLELDDIMDLRVHVLRKGTPVAHAHYAEDSYADVVHFGIYENSLVVATSTWFLKECPEKLGALSMQLKGMAVSTSLQTHGLGKKIIERGIQHAHDNAAVLIWARARDSALGFYERCEFEVRGAGFIDEPTNMPHHIVVREILL